MCQAPLNAQELLDQIRSEYGPGELTRTDGRTVGRFSNVTVPLGTYNYMPYATGVSLYAAKVVKRACTVLSTQGGV